MPHFANTTLCIVVTGTHDLQSRASYSVLCLKRKFRPVQDSRKGHDGKPLRRSSHLPVLARGGNTLESSIENQCLYEAQISVIVTGIDHQVWTTYGCFDTYYGTDETADSYLNKGLITNRMGDPLTASKFRSNGLPSTPREYFFKVFEIRLIQVLRQWEAIVELMEEDVEMCVRNLFLFNTPVGLKFVHAISCMTKSTT